MKKNFCDGWDNIFSLLIPNVVSLGLGICAYLLLSVAFQVNSMLAIICFISCVVVIMIPVFAWGDNAKRIADFEAPSVMGFFRSIAHTWKRGALFGLFAGLLIVVGIFSIPYYLALFKKGSLVGLLFAAIIFWFLFIATLSLQWFIPLSYLQPANGIKKAIKKCFIIFFDNPGFSFAVFLYNIVLSAFSFLLFFLLPGTAGITLALTNALRLRLYKYDWIEAHPEVADDRDKRSEVPWAELIAEDKDSLGPRTLSSFIFPWKN